MKFDYKTYEENVNRLSKKNLDETHKYQITEMSKFLEKYKDEIDSKAKEDIYKILNDMVYFSTNENVNWYYDSKAEAQAVYDTLFEVGSPIAPMLTDGCDMYKDGDKWVIDLIFYGAYVPSWEGFEE